MYNSGIVSNSTTDTYTYGNSDWGDLLTAYNGEGITYDANGNPLSYYNGKRYTFSWQYGRRLASLGVDGKTYTYTYNAEGLRVTKTVDGVVHSYFYDGTELLMEKWGNCYLRFTYDEQGRPFSVDYYNGTTLETYYYVLNLQGDVIEIRNSINNVVCKYTYDAWGKILSVKDGSGNDLTTAGHIGNLNPLRYRGYYYDSETGLYYLRSRYYDPVICRFVNADGYVSTGQRMLGYNMFSYCENNPISRIDPSGTSWLVAVVLIVCGVIGGIAGACSDTKLWEYNPDQEDNSDGNGSSKEELDTEDRIINAFIGTGIGVGAGGLIVSGVGAGGTIVLGSAKAALFGSTGGQLFAVGALIYNSFAITFGTIFGVEMTLVET